MKERVKAPFRCRLAAAFVLLAQGGALAQSPSAPQRSYPADVDAHSGFRLPLPKPEHLDDAGRKTYEHALAPGGSIAGLQGPSGIQLYSPKAAEHLRGLNQYLRYHAGFAPATREIAILAVAREMDSQFEWSAHEPVARKAGVAADTIEAIKSRGNTSALPETDAAIIESARELFHDHKLSATTFARVKARFNPNQLVDLVLLMCDYAGTAALLTAFDMQLHAGEQPTLPSLKELAKSNPAGVIAP